MKMQKMTQIDLDKFQNHGCPFCKAFAYMDAMGVDKEVKSPLYPRSSWNWNVIWRHNGISGDGNIYIWGVTQTHFNALIQQIKQDKTQGVFTLDPDKGFDLTLQATGEGLQRRYGSPTFDRMSSPANLREGDIPYDLAEVVLASSYKTYQDMVNNLKIGFGARLRELGYVIPGDISVEQAYAQTPQSFQQVNPQNTEQLNKMYPQQVPSMQQPIIQSNRIDKGNGYYEIDGCLYDPTGKKLF